MITHSHLFVPIRADVYCIAVRITAFDHSFQTYPSRSQDFFYTICIFIPIGESASSYSDCRKLIVSWTVILGTDAALCFDREVECIWKRRFSLITIVYAVQRYASIIENVLGYVDPYMLTVRICFCETHTTILLISARRRTYSISSFLSKRSLPNITRYPQLQGGRDHTEHSLSCCPVHCCLYVNQLN